MGTNQLNLMTVWYDWKLWKVNLELGLYCFYIAAAKTNSKPPQTQFNFLKKAAKYFFFFFKSTRNQTNTQSFLPLLCQGDTHQSRISPTHSFDQSSTAVLLFSEYICKEMIHPSQCTPHPADRLGRHKFRIYTCSLVSYTEISKKDNECWMFGLLWSACKCLHSYRWSTNIHQAK